MVSRDSGSCFYYAGAHRDLHSFPTRRSSDLRKERAAVAGTPEFSSGVASTKPARLSVSCMRRRPPSGDAPGDGADRQAEADRKSTRLNSSDGYISYDVFCLNKKIATKDAKRD